jgi:HlyD family secretion protein
MKRLHYTLIILSFIACNKKEETTKPTKSSISESIYASGTVKSKNQYQAFATVSGIIEEVLVSEGDSLQVGTVLLKISNKAQQFNLENAELAANFSDISANQGKLNDAKQLIDLSKRKLKSDSLLYTRQQSLWNQKIGSKVELEQRELAFQNSSSNYYSAVVKYNDLKRQLEFNAAQSKKNVNISSKIEDDYTVKSEINGKLYSLTKSKGDLITPQIPLAVIGDAKKFIIELQVDEYDILFIKKGLNVMVTLDSYKDKVFKAAITKINPIMNERTKTFLVEAEFINAPEILYPNISLEANIIIQTKENVLLIPRNYLLPNSKVINANGDTIAVQTGLKDYQKIEVISGLTENDELIKPVK